MKQLKKYYDIKLTELKKLRIKYEESIQKVIDISETIIYLEKNKTSYFVFPLEILKEHHKKLVLENAKITNKYYAFIEYLKDFENYLKEKSKEYKNLNEVEKIKNG